MDFSGNPLVSDERTRNPVQNIDFGGTPTGLDIGGAPALPMGLQGMPDFQGARQNIIAAANAPLAPTPAPTQQAQIYLSPSTGTMVVNGFSFNQRNASQALQSEQYARQPAQQFTLPDTANDWRAVSAPEYAAYIDSIRNPGFGRRVGEAWEHAWRGMGDTYLGAGLAVNPDWEWGQEARQNLVREFEENAPFMLRMRDVENPGDALTYASQMLVQGVPWLIDTMAWMAAGAVVTGGVGAPVGSAEALIAREAIRRGTANAVRTSLTNGARAYEAARAASGAATVTRAEVLAHAGAGAADDVNRFFNFGERAFELTRGARINLGSPGAVGAGFLSNYATGVGDIRNTITDAGGDPTTAESMAQIWGMALPYAAIESVGDLIITQPLTQVFPDMLRGASRAGNAARGFGLGMATEGVQETAQYGITQNAAAVATDTPISLEPMDLLETFVGGGLAGAGIGGVLGALATPNRPTSTVLPSTPAAPAGAPPSFGDDGPGSMGGMSPIDLTDYQSERLPPVGDDGPGPMGGLVPPTFNYEDRPYTPTEEIMHGRTAVPPSPQANMQSERVRLQEQLLTVTDPQQRANILQALEALQGGRDVNMEAADRAASQIGSGYIDPGNMQGPPDLRVPITEQELAGLKTEIAQQRAPKPTNVVPGPVPEDNTGITDPNDPEFQRRWPELAAYLAMNPQQPYISPMEAAQQKPLDRQAVEAARMEKLVNEAPRAGPLRTPDKSKLKPPISQAEADRQQAQANLSRIGNDGLRVGPDKAATAQPTKGDELRARARELAEKPKADEQSARAIKDTERYLAERARMEEDSRDYLKNGPKRKRGGDGAKLPKLESERGRALVERLGKKFGPKEDAKKEEPETDAVQERSPEAAPVPDKPRASEETGKRDAPRSEAPRESAKPAGDEEVSKPEVREYKGDPDDELVDGYTVSKKRIDKAYAAGVAANPPTLFNFLQSARGSMPKGAKLKNRETPITTRHEWAKPDGKPLSMYELQAVINRLLALGVSSKTPMGTAAPKVEAKPAPKASKVKKPKPPPLPPEVSAFEQEKARRETARAAAADAALQRSFGSDMSKFFSANEGKTDALTEYVRFNLKEIKSWLASDDAKTRAGLRVRVEKYLPKGPDVKLAAMLPPKRKFAPFMDPAVWGEDNRTALIKARNAVTEALSRTAEKVHHFKLEYLGRVGKEPQLYVVNDAGTVFKAKMPVAKSLIAKARQIANVTDTTVPSLQQNLRLEPDFLNASQAVLIESSSGLLELRMPEEIKPATAERLLSAVNATPHNNIRVVQMDKDGRQHRTEGKAAALDAIYGANKGPDVKLAAQVTGRDGKSKPKLSTEEIKLVTNGVMKRLPAHLRYRSVHIVENFQEWLDGIDTIKMKGEDGKTYTLREVAQWFDPDTKPEVWLAYNFSEGGAAHIQHFNAFYLDKTHLQQGNEDELLSVIEHELVVHYGLDVLFPDEAAKQEFLIRVGQIPGIEEQRQQLLWMRPTYNRYPYYTQIEEVIAFTAMEGPLALEALLSLPESASPAMRKGLWEEFKQLVKNWIKLVFGDTQTTADMVLDFIVSGLREHAILGEKVDLNQRLTAIGVPTYEEMRRRAPHLPKLQVKMMATTSAAASLEDTQSLLYSGKDKENPGRAYTPKPPGQQIKEIFESTGSFVEGAKKTLEDVGATSAMEAWNTATRAMETMNNMADRSTLVEKTMDIMHNTVKLARRIMTEVQETRHYATDAAEFAKIRSFFGNKHPGSTKKERMDFGRIAVVAANNKLPLTTEKVVRAATRIHTEMPDGTLAVIRDANGHNAVVEELLVLGTVTKEELATGIAQYTVTGDGNAKEVDVVTLPQDVIDSAYDKIYLPETRHMAYTKLRTFEASINMLAERTKSLVSDIIKANKVSAADQAFVSETLSRMHKLYSNIAFKDYTTISKDARGKQQTRARAVLAELMRTMHEAAKVKDWTDSTLTRADTKPNPRNKGKPDVEPDDAFKWRNLTDPHEDVAPYVAQIKWFLDTQPGTSISRLEHLHNLNVVEGNAKRQFEMLGSFQALMETEVQVRQKENDLIQSIMGNYMEFTRKGNNRVYVDVLDVNRKDKNGNPLPANIHAELRALLPVTYTKSLREAKQLQTDLMKELEGEHTLLDVDGNEITIKFDIGRGDSPGVSSLAEAPDVREFMRMAEILKMPLNADIIKRATNLMEHASERKRFGVQRAGTPGMDADILRNNSETMTRRAWEAAKIEKAHSLDSVYADNKNVFGDMDRLRQLQREFDIANRGAPEGTNPPTNFVRSEDAVYIAETKLLRYANQMRYMSKHTLANPTINIRTTKGEQKLSIKPEAEAHRAAAVALRESLIRNTLEVNLNDIVSKTGPLRMASVVLGLGSVAAGIMNPFTLITHVPFVLAARHSKTGYGEGHSYSDVITGIIQAFSQTFFRFDLEDSAKLKEVLDKAEKGDNTTNLTVDELKAMYEATVEGLLQPQQTYSLAGGTESNIGSLILRNLAQALMRPFGGTEAATRRVTFLVAYRLAKKRYIAAGIDPAKFSNLASAEFAELMQDITRAVHNSQGDHTNINRPKIFRGDLAQYVMQYKMFPLMTVLMMHNLPKKEQALFLGVLFLLAGLKGEPFAEDFMDIYDTLLQKLGFKHDSIELQLTQALEEIAPGSSKWVMHGFIDSLTFGGTMSSRLAMGDILPMTGAFREGADLGREITNAFGPAYASNTAALEWAWTLTDFTIQSMGLKPQTTSWQDLVRKMPQAQLRGIGEATLMATTGEITDPRGRLVSDDVTLGAIFTRALGFYPLEATKANDAVRLDRMHIGYMRSVRAQFVLAYANAYRADDQDRMDSIRRAVDEWNDAAEQTGQDDMLIRNFRSAAVRAGRAASQTTIERTSKGAPDYSLIDELAEIVNADTESED